ncbi:MAG: glycosyltransferase family 4 protein [Chloroflexota bacterium]
MTSVSGFAGLVGIIQRVLATYRQPFFEKLATTPELRLSVLAGQPLLCEAIQTADVLRIGSLRATRNHYLRGPAEFLCWQSGVIDWLCEFDPDVLIVEANPRLLSNWLAIEWMKYQKRPILGWGLGELNRSGSPLLCRTRGLIARRLVRSMDAMIAYSSKAARDYVSAGMCADRVFIAYNAIDNEESERYLEEFGRDMTWVRRWKESLQLDPFLPIVLYVGRLVPQKKVDLLMQACLPLFDRCQLLIVGDGPLRAELESQALLNGNPIRFIGHQSGETLAKCFIASDVFVLPGSGGLAVHQAMSYGNPVIVSFGDGTEADFVREGMNGVFVRPGDVDDLGRRIADLLAQPELRQVMSQASLSIVRNEMSMNSMVATFSRALAVVTNTASKTKRASW